jgi:hypothetical protein
MQAVSGTGRQDSTATLAAGQILCSEACDMFHSLNLTNKWNIPQGHWAGAFVMTCYNCGLPDHTSYKCPKPCNYAKIKKAKEARAKAVGEGSASGGHCCGRGGGYGGGCEDDQTNTWEKWGAKNGPADPGTNIIQLMESRRGMDLG